ncbi:FxSxx-COOH system tetratricopeptide repeat protein [Streptomyces pactum]|uniref:FxSxx-COOH system tetratricopeptide repeat protein n=1 Tax=Streptomyces pactum TaxID=68249 RepID=UPI0036FD4460
MTQDQSDRSASGFQQDLDWRQIADAVWLAVCEAGSAATAGPPGAAEAARDAPPVPEPPGEPAPPPGEPAGRRPPGPAGSPSPGPPGTGPGAGAPPGHPRPAGGCGTGSPAPPVVPHPTAPEPGPVPGAGPAGAAWAARPAAATGGAGRAYGTAVPAGRPAPGSGDGGPAAGERALARALRPLRRTVPSAVREEIDEEATAERAARQGLWLPVSAPAPERWMDAVLVVDRGSSMVVWRRTARQLAAVLERAGAFRTVRIHHLSSDLSWEPDRPGPARGRAAGPPSPVDGLGPRDRRAVLVLTDGVGEAWRDGSARRAVARWAGRATVAVLQVLSQSRWHNTGVSPERVRVRVPYAGAPNGSWERAQGGRWPGGRPPVPVLELDARWVHRWALLVTRPAPRGRDTLAMLPGRPPDLAPPGPEPSARERVLRFRATAAPSAFRLASRLAAAPLNIPVMEFVQRIMDEPGAAPGDLAEVLVGGLLRTVGTDPLDESAIGYEFHPGVRELLLSAGLRDESLYILRSVLDRLGRNWKPLHVLRDSLAAPSAAPADLPEPTERLLPYLRVQEQVYEALSGPYREGARTLRARVAAHRALGRSDDPPTQGRDVTGADAVEGFRRADGAVAVTGPAPPSGRLSPAVESPAAPAPGTRAGDAYPRGSSVSATAARSLPAVVNRRAGDPPAIWGNVPPRNNNFTGRQALLDALHERLGSEGTAAVLPEALHGLGGVGKSQIALEYVHQHANDYDAVWWIAAERDEQIRNALVELAESLGLQAGRESNVAVPRVLDALRTGRPCKHWLLVFDNAEDLETVRQYFPSGGPGRILVTSRNAQWSRAARTVEVDVFERSESVELLRRRGPELPPGQADRVAEALGDLPLAIEQAAAWLTETGMPVDEYLQVFEDERTDLSSRRSELLAAGVPVDYPEPVAAAWNMSLRRLAEHHPGALQLLWMCSFFAPEPISRRLFSNVRGVSLSPELSAVLQDPIKLGHAIREIGRYALIKINHRSNTIEMHRLVQAVLIGQMSPQQQADMRHSAHLLLAHGDPNEVTVPNWPRYTDLLSHVRASRALECDDKWVRQTVRNVIRFLYLWGDHEGALDFGGQVLEAWRETLGEESLETVAVARMVAHALNATGNFARAQELNARTLELLRGTVGDDHEDTLAAFASVAHDTRLRGDYQLSVELEHDRWRRSIRVFGDEDPFTLGAANDYALSLRSAGEFARARELTEQAREAALVILGETSLTRFMLETNLSIDVREGGDYLTARDMQELTFAGARRHVPKNAPVYSLAMRTLGVARRKAGDHAGALELSREALEHYRMRYSGHHLYTAVTLLNHSLDLRQNGDPGGAREAGRESLEALRSLLGARHPATLSAAGDLAVTLRLLGETEAALALDRETWPVLVERVGADHPAALSCAVNLASDHYTLGDHEQARRLDAEALDGCRRRLGPEHPTTLQCALNLAADLRALGERQQAQEMQQEALAKLREVLGEGHPVVVAAARGVRADIDIEVYSF